MHKDYYEFADFLEIDDEFEEFVDESDLDIMRESATTPEAYLEYLVEAKKMSEKKSSSDLIEQAIECLNKCKENPSEEVIELINELVEACSDCNTDDESEEDDDSED